MLVIYRTRGEGLVWWHYDLFVNAGADVYVVSAFLNGRAGSEGLDKDYPASLLLRTSLLSFKVLPVATSQPATTQPASP